LCRSQRGLATRPSWLIRRNGARRCRLASRRRPSADGSVPVWMRAGARLCIATASNAIAKGDPLMCGIAGIVASDRLHADERARAEMMRDVVAHRGPDDAGIFTDEYAALGHRRLSIVDLAAGHQPLANEDDTIWIVFNGEIYNHADVRPELEGAGHRYRTRSDTETIVHAYEQWGDACVERLRGMFAFAIWDAPRRRLLLARDRLGVKPLYWAEVDGRLLFASEIKSILESGLIAARPNEAALPGASAFVSTGMCPPADMSRTSRACRTATRCSASAISWKRPCASG
jgi:asparagine synthase (glutamine-hydrolysing)